MGAHSHPNVPQQHRVGGKACWETSVAQEASQAGQKNTADAHPVMGTSISSPVNSLWASNSQSQGYLPGNPHKFRFNANSCLNTGMLGQWMEFSRLQTESMLTSRDDVKWREGSWEAWWLLFGSQNPSLPLKDVWIGSTQSTQDLTFPQINRSPYVYILNQVWLQEFFKRLILLFFKLS